MNIKKSGRNMTSVRSDNAILISILYRMPKRRHINLKKLCTDILRSSLFLSSNTVLFMIVLCFL
uniref:Uncharacterized protein n=1 Tax=Romanomermis culicivorax TaxID=13658 RepID=A0A915HSX8_ROMCU